MVITILGRRWRLLYRRLKHGGGYCDPPDKPRKAISVDSRLVGDELEWQNVWEHTYWPHTDSQEWCGEWEAKE